MTLEGSRPSRGRLGLVVLWLSTSGAAFAAQSCGSGGSAPPGVDASVAGDAMRPAPGADGALATGDAGDDGGASVDAGPVDPKQACVDYIAAYCAKEIECTGPQRDCALAAAACPEYLLSPGSTRTVDSIETCASALQTVTCADFLVGVLPACVTPGTLPPGAPCAFESQCASLFCIGDGQSCGHCANLPTPEAGTRCGGYFECSPGFVCDRSTGACWPAQGQGASCTPSGNPPTLCEDGIDCLSGAGNGTTGTCGTLPDAGSACVRAISRFDTSAGTCAGPFGVACVGAVDGGAPGTCEGPAAEHAPCLAGQCDEAHYCALADASTQGTCEPLPGPGAPCAGRLCADGSYCGIGLGDAGTMGCHPRVALGQPCIQISASAVDPCGAGAQCTVGGVCAASSRGDPCDASTRCLFPLACGASGTCEPVDPASCAAPLDAGPG